MTANEAIESYVADVAVQLPRKLRNDVAFELRTLLTDQLQDKADSLGRALDVEMATEMLRAFGHPRTVAARYQPALNIIDPADGHSFMRISIAGLAVIWLLGLVKSFQQPIRSGWDLLSVASQWWSGSLIPSLWWPGLLVVCFGISAWSRSHWPQDANWTPRAHDRLRGGPAAMVLALVGMVCGLYILVEPRWILDVIWDGRAAPAAYQALTYTDTFLHRQGPFLFAVIALYIPMYVVVIFQGRWSTTMRSAETSLSLMICAAMAWAVMDGPIFLASASDQMTKLILALLTAFSLLLVAMQLIRRVRPAPNRGDLSFKG